jgi:hypothetical protein
MLNTGLCLAKRSRFLEGFRAEPGSTGFPGSAWEPDDTLGVRFREVRVTIILISKTRYMKRFPIYLLKNT